MKEYVIIVAGGSGSRMGSNIPKQFLELDGKPILMHTIEAFLLYNGAIEIILVLPEGQISHWEELVHKHQFSPNFTIAKGGTSRYASVKSGLSKIKEEGLVAIHDGVRPFVDTAVIQNAFKTAKAKGNAITSVALKDSIRKVLPNGGNQTEDRTHYRTIQTPQTFQSQLLKGAYEVTELPTFTDDASVIEHAGHSIHLVEGSYENIKITTPEDLYIAEALLKKRHR
ncbi:2-C-methyl-D-erythritol 4-phosphate cytidylyltransferase [Persicobacter sp. CCB-QB2]|uniref:2-C-methyl-D-erythritol 4-phosphate cytidylyltransferase n=1 Tax=Persicobacter sp. CCB-QB2 TaxID=1561025 RepID=UPI0006A94AE7|nr:2-C-methyl-D-erythritol 4-phosphate cytidylyltransferase [Persicobacter sp. CCB-QB2]